tara:strand:- start:454 stop:876 length:423 start_codon:yes stop_codon:yes gene_type:complete
MNIQHSPLFDTARVEQLYTEKDGVEVKYVCTSATNGGTLATDVFYRDTPHPEFGNHYFALYRNPFADNAEIMITNADSIESYEFGMIEDDGKYYYSQHRHDHKVVGEKMIDGGRAYIRSSGKVDVFKIQGGEFVRYEPSE